MVVKEGLFLYEHGVPPYNGGVCHQVDSPRFLCQGRMLILGTVAVSFLFNTGECCAFRSSDIHGIQFS